MPVNRNTDPYGGRFASDPTGGSVLAGYQQATDKLDRDLVKRNIKPYAKYGFEQSVSELAGMTDQARYKMATKAVLAKNKVGVKPKKSAPKKTKAQPRRTPVKPKATPKPKAAPRKPAPRKTPPKKTVKPRTKTPASVRKALAKGKPPVVKVTPKPPPLYGGRPPLRV